MFHNIQNNNAPMYLCDLIPPSIQSTTVYPLRNGSDIIIPFCRLSITCPQLSHTSLAYSKIGLM
jgi:hypothetical protein